MTTETTAAPVIVSAPSVFDFAAHDIAVDWLEGRTAERVLATAKAAGIAVGAADIAIIAEEVTRCALYGLGAARDTSTRLLAAHARSFWAYLADSRTQLAAGSLTDCGGPCTHQSATYHALQHGPLVALAQATTTDPAAGQASEPCGLVRQYTAASARKVARGPNSWMESYGEGLADAAAREMFDRLHLSHSLTGHVWETDPTKRVSQNPTKLLRSALLALASTDPATNPKNRFANWLAFQSRLSVQAVVDHLIHKRSRERYSLNEQVESDSRTGTERGDLVPAVGPSPEEQALDAVCADDAATAEQRERAAARAAAAAAHLDAIAARSTREQTGRFGLYERLGRDARHHLAGVLGVPVRKARRPLDPAARDRHMAVLGVFSGPVPQRDVARVSHVALAAVRLAFWTEIVGDAGTAVQEAGRHRHLHGSDGPLPADAVAAARSMAVDLFAGYDIDVLEAFAEPTVTAEAYGADPRAARTRAARAAGDIAREACSDLRRPGVRDFERMVEAAVKYVATAMGGHEVTVRAAVLMLLRCEYAAISDKDNESAAAKAYLAAEDRVAAGALLRQDVAWTDWWTTLRSVPGSDRLGTDPYQFRARLLAVAETALAR